MTLTIDLHTAGIVLAVFVFLAALFLGATSRHHYYWGNNRLGFWLMAASGVLTAVGIALLILVFQ